ncbi:MAG: c-type cytochrome [Pseudomonadota bacterium]
MTRAPVTGLFRALVLAALLAAPVLSGPAAAEESAGGYALLEGHGGPVKGLAVSPDGRFAATASFDTALGLWSLPEGRHLRWLDGHEAAANAVLFLPEGRMVSAGDDFALILWEAETGTVERRFKGHKGKIISLAAAADGKIASAGWDGLIGLWDLNAEQSGPMRWLEGHQANVNDVVFSRDGQTLYSASYDGTIRRWDLSEEAPRPETLRSHGFGVNHLLLDEEAGWLAYGALDGAVRALDLATGETIADLTTERRPILAMVRAPGGQFLATGDGEGYVTVIDTETWTIERDFRAALMGPIWALAWAMAPDGSPGRVLAGGLADEAALWPVLDDAAEAAPFAGGTRAFHRDPVEMTNGERQFMRKCSICHTLTGDGGRKAGPSLANLFGRRAGTLPGYRYSEALTGSDIIWNAETIGALFRQGPDVFTPGSKMPIQRIAKAADRADLIDYLRDETNGAARESAPDTTRE